jgi:hypothetical protein
MKNWSLGDHARLVDPFPGSSFISQNKSQAWQDIWVLTVTRGARCKRYLEVGANDPTLHNNTWLLSQLYNWSGVSIEYDPSHITSWSKVRSRDKFICADALLLDYTAILTELCAGSEKRVDYLQLDIEPSINTLQVLKRLPLDEFRFSTITFETDAYLGDLRAQKESRDLLKSKGYVAVFENVTVRCQEVAPDPIPFEDWWIDLSYLQEIGATQVRVAKNCFPSEYLLSP